MSEPFDLLARIQADLSGTLEMVPPGEPEGIFAAYIVHAARHVNEALQGYVTLKRAGQLSAAAHMVRPSIEVMLKIRAIRFEPEVLLRIQYGETLEDEKWLKTLNPEQFIQDNADQIFKSRRESFAKAFQNEMPQSLVNEIPCSGLKVYDLASKAQISVAYKVHYRLFCRHSHGDLSAMTNFYRDVEDADTVMIVCAFELLTAMEEAGYQSPCLPMFADEMGDLFRSREVALGRE